MESVVPSTSLTAVASWSRSRVYLAGSAVALVLGGDDDDGRGCPGILEVLQPVNDDGGFGRLRQER